MRILLARLDHLMAYVPFLGYLLAHWLAYAIWLKRVPGFETERGIFFYHIASFGLVAAVALGLALLRSPGLEPAHVVAFAALHGIYSLTFLELWALTDGGFSFTMIEIYDAGRADQSKIEAALVELGQQKQRARLDALQRQGLVEWTGTHYHLRQAGRWPVRFLSLVRMLANLNLEY